MESSHVATGEVSRVLGAAAAEFIGVSPVVRIKDYPEISTLGRSHSSHSVCTTKTSGYVHLTPVARYPDDISAEWTMVLQFPFP